MEFTKAMRLILSLLLFCFASWGFAQDEAFSLQTEAELSLSLYQEGEEALSRAERWMSHQTRRHHLNVISLPETERAAFHVMLTIEAIALDHSPIYLDSLWMQETQRFFENACSEHSPLMERFKVFNKALLTETFQTLTVHPIEVACYHFYLNQISQRLQQGKCVELGSLPVDWRSQLTLQLINTQRCDVKGGFWQPPQEDASSWCKILPSFNRQTQPHDATVWAIYLLRNLMSQPRSLQPTSTIVEKIKALLVIPVDPLDEKENEAILQTSALSFSTIKKAFTGISTSTTFSPSTIYAALLFEKDAFSYQECFQLATILLSLDNDNLSAQEQTYRFKALDKILYQIKNR